MVLTAINMFGGFAVTRACWHVPQVSRREHDMSQSLATVSYIGATILFILSLGGCPTPETSRRGNLFGMVGMAWPCWPPCSARASPRAASPGSSVRWWSAAASACTPPSVVQMTQMPELVALMHSLVGLAACLVGFASYVDTSIRCRAPRKPSTRWRSTSAS
jgi:NAD(P) transhydrogenase subunit beta